MKSQCGHEGAADTGKNHTNSHSPSILKRWWGVRA